jgi:hypothetical protein
MNGYDKMNLFGILNHLYTDSSSKWIQEFDEEDEQLSPFIIQEWLCLNDSIRVQVRYLDRYTYIIPLKMYLSLAWSIIPKSTKAPFVRWIPKIDSDEEWGFILSKVRKHLNLSDNDYKTQKLYILSLIKKDMYGWFAAYGVEKKYWNKFNMDFGKIKQYGVTRVIEQKGLEQYGV